MQRCRNLLDAPTTFSASRLAGAAVLALFLCGSGAIANAASEPVAQASPGASIEGFGAPPSGQIPILYNDHTVYTRPDILKQSRVLAALVRNGTILIPLRSMFEQMGATVTYDPSTKTVDVTKPGSDIKVTIDVPQVVVNGETRPLDVPPMMYQGQVLVPVRVISEGMGAYVLWVSDRRLVVVRYIPATPAPVPPPPPPAPTPMPTLAPIPTPTPYSLFIQGAIGPGAKNYNEFSAGQYCDSYLLAIAYLFPNSPFAIKGDFRQDTYVTSDNIVNGYGNHLTQFSTIDGGAALTPVFLAKQTSYDGRLEYQVATPHIYVGVGYMQAANNYGYPRLSGFGAGVEKLPDMHSGINWFGSVFYYPTASGNYTVSDPTSINFGTVYRQQYAITKYDVGLSLVLPRFPMYLYGGFSGDSYAAKRNAPIGQTHAGPYIGLGVKF